MAEGALSPAKVILLATHFAASGNVTSLRLLAAQQPGILSKEKLLRIIITYLPETIPPKEYTEFLLELAAEELVIGADVDLDISPVREVSDDEARKRVRKLRLQRLYSTTPPSDSDHNVLTTFLCQRARRMDEDAGMLHQVPDLLLPFVEYSPTIKSWLISTIIPLSRRNCEYYPRAAKNVSISDFERLEPQAAVDYLLSGIVRHEHTAESIGRDLRGLVGPWLRNNSHWDAARPPDGGTMAATQAVVSCEGWDEALKCLLLRSADAWQVIAEGLAQWGGPDDLDIGRGLEVNDLDEAQKQYLRATYARSALAVINQMSNGTVDTLAISYRLLSKAKYFIGQASSSNIEEAASMLEPASRFSMPTIPSTKSIGPTIGDLHRSSGVLDDSIQQSTDLLGTLLLSAFLLARVGGVCTLKMVEDLVFLGDQREQKMEAAKFIRLASSAHANMEDDVWLRSRRELLWLHDWSGHQTTALEGGLRGVFGKLSREYVETELLQAMLLNGRYELARSIYEREDSPLAQTFVQDTVYKAALNAFDNASNLNRNRGGLKKCDEVIQAFPTLVPTSLPRSKEIQSLLSAAHALSEYRLVLKQGEPFSPVVLRIHSDPLTILAKVLDQNRGAYTRIQEFLEIGFYMVTAGLVHRLPGTSVPLPQRRDIEMLVAEKRIVSMCIEAALNENDFETAYSYVASKLDGTGADTGDHGVNPMVDEWSWNAALKAGQFTRAIETQQPTHLGTASGNPKIRHLEQRIECLATALRVAPSSQLQEILKSFRRCEEQLDSAIMEEAAKEEAWDVAGEMKEIPGTFNTREPGSSYPPRNISARATAQQGEEAPMSLFDLSRATAKAAQRNLTTLSNLQGVAQGLAQNQDRDPDTHGPRVRKRDQLREAATGTLVSGVGWLIGANVNQTNDDTPS